MPDDDIGAMFDGFFDEPTPPESLHDAPALTEREHISGLGLDGPAAAAPVESLPEAPHQWNSYTDAPRPAAAREVDPHDACEQAGVGFIFGASGGLMGGGIASINGAKPFAYQELPGLIGSHPGVTFTSLLPPTSAHVVAGVDPKSVVADLYPTPNSALAVELGSRLAVGSVDIESETSSSVATLSGVLSKADMFLGRFLGESIAANHKGSRADLVSRVLSKRLGVVNVAGRTSDKSSEEHEERICCDVRGWVWQSVRPANARNLHLRLQSSRSFLAECVFNLASPVGVLADVDPDMTSVADAINAGDVCYALVSIKSARDALAVAFGKSLQTRNRSIWFAAHELDVFAPYANLSLDRVVRSLGGDKGADLVGMELGLSYPAGSALLSASISAGLAYEAIMYGLSGVKGGRHEELVGAWVRSMLRGAMLKEALRLQKVGFSVVEVGLTHVSISVPKANLSRLRSYMLTGTRLMLPVGWSWAA